MQALRAAGIGYQQIARLAGTSVNHLREIAHTVVRSGSRPPIRRIRRDLAVRLLAITPDPANRAAHSQIDATGTQRRLQALIAAGWPETELASRLGRTLTNLRRSMTSHTVTARTAALVNDLYEELAITPVPVATEAQRRASAAARSLAAKHQWSPPLAWDDIDRDPEPHRPTTRPHRGNIDSIAVDRAIAGDRIRRSDLNRAEQAVVVRRLTQRGRSIRVIAEQLGATNRTISRRRQSTGSTRVLR